MDEKRWTTVTVERRHVQTLRKMGWAANKVLEDWINQKQREQKPLGGLLDENAW